MKINLTYWVSLVLNLNFKRKSLTIRFVDSNSIRRLNKKYLGSDVATNVLSFAFECKTYSLLGDIILCTAIVTIEAKAQEKSIMDHFAHIILHGTLHLLGFSHIEKEAKLKLELIEQELLANLGIDDPYSNEEILSISC